MPCFKIQIFIAEYFMMFAVAVYLTDNKSNLELTIENAQLEKENNSLKNENKLLKAVINKVSDFIEKHNMPEPLKRGLKEIIDRLTSSKATESRYA